MKDMDGNDLRVGDRVTSFGEDGKVVELEPDEGRVVIEFDPVTDSVDKGDVRKL